MNVMEPVVRRVHRYCPPGVKSIIASGGGSWIGEVDETTIMKYPHFPEEEMPRIEAERKMLEVLGTHERIIQLKGATDQGILLERAANGDMANYLCEVAVGPDAPPTSTRLRWCRELAEAATYVHSCGILHCDINPMNLLLDKNLHVKLSDFQGKHISAEDGSVLLDGWSAESCRYHCPRDDIFDADTRTELFALGSTIYFIIMGHAVYPDISDGMEDYQEQVQGRFAKGLFPQDEHSTSARRSPRNAGWESTVRLKRCCGISWLSRSGLVLLDKHSQQRRTKKTRDVVSIHPRKQQIDGMLIFF